MARIAREDEEIDEVLNKASEGIDGGSRWPGMSYEEGVQNGIMWVLGHFEDNPMADD